MNLPFFIPTLRRSHRQITLSSLPSDLKALAWLVLDYSERDQFAAYAAVHPQVLICPDGISGIHKTRQWLVDTYQGNKLLMLDDDLTFAARRPGEGTKLFKATDDEIRAMFTWLESSLDTHAHVAVSMREGNNHVEEDFVECTRMVRVLGWRSDIFKKEGIIFDRNPVMEDFDVTLQLLRKGFPNIVSFRFAQNQSGSDVDGGCSTYRTSEVQEAGANKLKELHPDFVRVEQKVTKGSWQGKPRTDVRVYWKKAFESSGKVLEKKSPTEGEDGGEVVGEIQEPPLPPTPKKDWSKEKAEKPVGFVKSPRYNLLKVSICHQKNSIAWIAKHIQSVWDLVDKILIVDHLSTDGTWEYLQDVMRKCPEKFVTCQYPDPNFDEMAIRKWTFDAAVHFFGVPTWVIYMDGDEVLGHQLRAFLHWEFKKDSSEVDWAILDHGWEHLYGDDRTQILSRRSGTIAKIFNTFKFLDMGICTKEQYQNLTWLNVLGKPPEYRFHIASFPDQLRARKSPKEFRKTRKFVWYPVSHYGFFCDAEIERKRHHHVVLLGSTGTDQQLLDLPVKTVGGTSCMPLKIGEIWGRDLHSLPYYGNKGFRKMKFPDFEGPVEAFQIFQGKKILFGGWDEARWTKKVTEAIPGIQISLFRFPMAFQLGWIDKSEVKLRSEKTWVSWEALPDSKDEYDFFVLPEEHEWLRFAGEVFGDIPAHKIVRISVDRKSFILPT